MICSRCTPVVLLATHPDGGVIRHPFTDRRDAEDLAVEFLRSGLAVECTVTGSAS